jgi:hypothetical protein
MSDAIAQIGKFLSSSGGKAAETGAVAGGGFLQNWLANREAQKKQNFVEGLITDPAKLQKFVAGFDRPLSAGLTADVARSADAYGAERGLGSSPAVMKDVYAQALAPSVEAEKNAALQAALQSLGIYGNTPTTKPVDITSLLKALQMGTPSASPGVTGQMPTNVPPVDVNSLGLLSGPAPLPTPSIGDDVPATVGQ